MDFSKIAEQLKRGLQRASQFFSEKQKKSNSKVRAQVFEVIVRQALAGAPWREIFIVPMQVNNINPVEVEAEVERRKRLQ